MCGADQRTRKQRLRAGSRLSLSLSHIAPNRRCSFCWPACRHVSPHLPSDPTRASDDVVTTWPIGDESFVRSTADSPGGATESVVRTISQEVYDKVHSARAGCCVDSRRRTPRGGSSSAYSLTTELITRRRGLELFSNGLALSASRFWLGQILPGRADSGRTRFGEQILGETREKFLPYGGRVYHELSPRPVGLGGSLPGRTTCADFP